MTPSEKLRRLIEIAQSNGWQPEFKITCAEEYGGTGTLQVHKKHVGYFNYEYIIFDHSFIQALCRAKKKFVTHEGASSYNGIVASRNLETTLKNLAISTNRIDYLWEVFGE